jgi:hypothetical protein
VSLSLSDSIHLLGNLLGEVLAAQESPALLAVEERIRALAKARRAGDAEAAPRLAGDVEALPTATARAVASAFTLYFDLVNLAEEVHRIQELRRRTREQAPAPIPEEYRAELAGMTAGLGDPSRRSALVSALPPDLIVVLGHSGCGAVSAAVDVFLEPTRYLALATSHSLRNILDRLLVVVQASAKRMQEILGPDVINYPGYRNALVETSVVTNAALAAVCSSMCGRPGNE